MSWIFQFFNRLPWWRNTPENDNSQNLEKFFGRWEPFIMELQELVLWKNPIRSLLCIGAVNLIFWIVVYLEWRLYGLFFFSMLVAVVFDGARQMGLIGPCRGPTVPDESLAQDGSLRLFTVEELSSCVRMVGSKARSACTRMKVLREEQPATFCLVTCCACLALSIIGRVASGITVLYSLLMTALIAPALCVRFPLCLQYLPTFTDNINEEDEYLPDSPSATKRILDLIGERLTDGSDPLKVPGEAEGATKPSPDYSLDYLGPDVDLPSPRQLDQDLSDESDLSEPHDIEFKNKHFNGDGSSSSSSDEFRFRGTKEPIQRQGSTDSNDSFELISKDEL